MQSSQAVRLAGVTLALIILPQALWARTPIRFVFEIGECASSTDPQKCHPYGRQFAPADRNWIHDTVTSAVSAVLIDEFPPFDFHSAAPQQYVLRARLTDGPIATARTAVFSLSIDGSPGGMDIEYRDAVHYGAVIPERDVFALELSNRLASEIKRLKQDIIARLLRKLPISTGAFPLPTQKMFILTFAEDDMKIGKDSEFLIEAVDADSLPWDFETVSKGPSLAGSSVPNKYVSKVLTLAVRPAESLAHLKPGAVFTPGAIHLLRYEPPPPRLQPVPALTPR